MKLYNLIIVVYAVLLVSCDQGKYEENYKTGELKLAGQLDSNSRKIGTWVKYDINGNVIAKYYYTDDSLNLQESYTGNSLSIKEEMLDGIKDGKTIVYYS